MDISIKNLLQRLERAELIHLREHIEELRARLEAVTLERDDALERANWAEDRAEMWRDDALRSIEESGATVGLTIGGHIVAVPGCSA